MVRAGLKFLNKISLKMCILVKFFKSIRGQGRSGKDKEDDSTPRRQLERKVGRCGKWPQGAEPIHGVTSCSARLSFRNKKRGMELWDMKDGDLEQDLGQRQKKKKKIKQRTKSRL